MPAEQRRVGRPPRSVFSRLADKVLFMPDGCISFIGGLDRQGYGEVNAGPGRSKFAHRIAYEAIRGPVPAGLDLDHLCRNRRCVNPFHLEAVTHRLNVLRGVGPSALHAKKTHCKSGHPLSGANLYIYCGHRMCRTCRAFRESVRTQG